MAMRYADVLARWAEKAQEDAVINTARLLNVVMSLTNVDRLTVTQEDMIRAYSTHTVKIEASDDGATFTIIRSPVDQPDEE